MKKIELTELAGIEQIERELKIKVWVSELPLDVYHLDKPQGTAESEKGLLAYINASGV